MLANTPCLQQRTNQQFPYPILYRQRTKFYLGFGYRTEILYIKFHVIARSYQGQSVCAWYKLLYSIVQVVRCRFGGRRQGIALSNTPTYDLGEFGLRPLTSETKYFYR